MLKKTFQAVLESGNDYLVAVKGNQPKLLAHLQTFSRHLKPKDIHHSEVIQKGRVDASKPASLVQALPKPVAGRYRGPQPLPRRSGVLGRLH